MPRFFRCWIGLIPTGVGNTGVPCHGSCWAWAHPHGCGEHVSYTKSKPMERGLSPRVWGTPRDVYSWVRHKRRHAGLIPTGVGNTLVSCLRLLLHRAHPHGCGEHGQCSHSTKSQEGSSPRVWGTHPTPRRRRRPRGLIPTGVGNTWLYCSTRSRNRAHPHGCGEHAARTSAACPPMGSSPRVWGTRVSCLRWLSGRGLIPTGVGNTGLVIDCGVYSGAHPHGCGEHDGRATPHDGGAGSSPRVWGTRNRTTLWPRTAGLIPTGVGNTVLTCAARSSSWAHPHGCGEHAVGVALPPGSWGSSPRVWGTLQPDDSQWEFVGLIPTGVGNTCHTN